MSYVVRQKWGRGGIIAKVSALLLVGGGGTRIHLKGLTHKTDPAPQPPETKRRKSSTIPDNNTDVPHQR